MNIGESEMDFVGDLRDKRAHRASLREILAREYNNPYHNFEDRQAAESALPRVQKDLMWTYIMARSMKLHTTHGERL